jgi:hypothetical protein
MSRRFTIALAAALWAWSGSGQAPSAQATYLEEAKITVNERARADGFMRVRVLPENGVPREATLAISRRMSENDLAKSLAEALNGVLGPDYAADRDAGEHVKLRKKERSAANFSVEITFNAPGFAIVLDK